MASASSRKEGVHEDDIDNDKLIEEVERRPILYDKTFDKYSDLKLKMKAWDEITRTLFSNVWCKLSPQHKFEAGHLVRKRWTNIRSCFLRELREQKSNSSSRNAKKRRKYKYFDQLLFLMSNVETRNNSGTADTLEDVDHSFEHVECIEEDTLSSNTEPQQCVHLKETINKTYEEKVLDILSKKMIDGNKFIEAVRSNRIICEVEDKEKHFALSLVPLLKAVPEEDKLEVQIKILRIFQEVQKQNSQKVMQFSSSSEQPDDEVDHKTDIACR